MIVASRFAILAAGVLLAGCANPQSASPGASAPGGGSPSPTASPTIAPVVGAWSRHELGLNGPMLSSLIGGGPGFIGGGASGEDAAIWTSPDGLAWTRTARAPSGPGRVNGLAADGSGFVAVGIRGASPTRAAAWTSPDGLTWSAVPDSPAFANADGSGNAEMNAVVRTASRFVAVGVEYGGASGQHGAAWTSTDGISWRRATLTDPGDWMRDIVVGGPGLVAVGTGVGELQRAAIWTSPDGSLWTLVEDGPLFEHAAASAVVAGPGGLVAVGNQIEPTTGALRPMAWTSDDGLGWRAAQVTGDPPPSGPPQAFEGSLMADVIRLAGGWLAVGSDLDIRTDGALINAAMWTSRDGASWTRLPDEPVFQGGISSGFGFGAGIVTQKDGEVVVFGRTAGPTPTVWLSPPRAGGSIPAPLPSAPPATPTPAPGQVATPAPTAPPELLAQSFRDDLCRVDAALFDVFGNAAGARGPDAAAFHDALAARKAKAIAATLPAVRGHLEDATRVLDNSIPWQASAEAIASFRLLAEALTANLDRIEAEAAAGRAPADGASAFFGEQESRLFRAAQDASQRVPRPSTASPAC